MSHTQTDQKADWNHYAKVFSAITSHFQSEVYREVVGYLYGHVADFGCGSAKLAPYLADLENVSRYSGVDASPEMVSAAEELLGKLNRPGFNVVQSTIEDMKLDSYQSAVSINSLYAWDHPLSNLQKIYKGLATGGSFTIVNPNPRLNMHKLLNEIEKDLLMNPYFAEFKFCNESFAANPHHHFLEMDALIGALKQCGFSISFCHQMFYCGGVNLVSCNKP